MYNQALYWVISKTCLRKLKFRGRCLHYLNLLVLIVTVQLPPHPPFFGITFPEQFSRSFGSKTITSKPLNFNISVETIHDNVKSFY